MPSVLDGRSLTFIVTCSFAGFYVLLRVIKAVSLSYQRSIFKREKGCKPEPRYPHIEPIFGIDTFIKTLQAPAADGYFPLLQRRFQLVSKTSGGTKYTYSSLLAGVRFIHTIEPENIKAILATQFDDFCMPDGRLHAYGPVLGYGIFASDGKEWEASRALLRPSFNRSQLGDIEVYEEHIQKLIARIPHDGSTFDIQELFYMLTIDTASEFLFGHSTDVLGTGEQHERGLQFADAFNHINEICSTVLRLGGKPFIRHIVADKKYYKGVEFVHSYVQDYIEKATRARFDGNLSKSDADDSEKKKYVFLEELLQTGASPKKIQDELLNILLAGRDTTAALLSFLFYTLARNPRVFKKLRAEVLALGSKRPTIQQIKDCKYLQWTLNEALRLFPVVGANGRMANKDTTIPTGGGPDGKSPVFVKKGQAVFYQVYLMHRRKDLYGEDAEEFKPERWERMRQGWHYLPFNGGPRICIGQQFAIIEASYTTIRLLQHFSGIEARDDSKFVAKLATTISVRGGVNIAMIPA